MFTVGLEIFDPQPVSQQINTFYDYVFMATCKTAVNKLFRHFKVSEGLYPGNSLAELWQGLLDRMRPLQLPEQIKEMSELVGVCRLIG